MNPDSTPESTIDEINNRIKIMLAQLDHLLDTYQPETETCPAAASLNELQSEVARVQTEQLLARLMAH